MGVLVERKDAPVAMAQNKSFKGPPKTLRFFFGLELSR